MCPINIYNILIKNIIFVNLFYNLFIKFLKIILNLFYHNILLKTIEKC